MKNWGKCLHESQTNIWDVCVCVCICGWYIYICVYAHTHMWMVCGGCVV